MNATLETILSGTVGQNVLKTILSLQTSQVGVEPGAHNI
jgi:hypothetical protein